MCSVGLGTHLASAQGIPLGSRPPVPLQTSFDAHPPVFVWHAVNSPSVKQKEQSSAATTSSTGMKGSLDSDMPIEPTEKTTTAAGNPRENNHAED